VSEKVYNQRKMLFEQARNNRGDGGMIKSSNFKTNVYITKTSEKDTSSNDVFKIQGRRIIHVKTLGVQMFCRKCQSVLSLTNIVDEKRIGLASIFLVKCNICCSVTGVNTDKQHEVLDQNIHFDSNTKFALGKFMKFFFFFDVIVNVFV